MAIFPSRTGLLLTGRTVEEPREILHRNVDEGSSWLRRRSKPLVGRIEGDCFTVARVLRGEQNSFGAILKGRVNSVSHARAVVEYRLVISSEAKVRFVIIQLACLIMLLITLAFGTPWQFQAYLFALAAGLLTLMWLGFASEVPRTERLLRELIGTDSTA